MAISKTQNERPAIIELIDAVNATEPIVAQNVQNIAALTESLGDEISNRESADAQLQSAIATLTENLDNETSNRESADAQLQSAIALETSNRTNADASIQNQIGTGVFSSDFTITQGFQRAGVTLRNINDLLNNIDEWRGRFKLGITQQFTVAPSDSHTESITFDTPFADDAQVLVLPNCVHNETTFGTLECKLIDATNSGFSFGVYNSDSDNSYTISVGFVAVQVN